MLQCLLKTDNVFIVQQTVEVFLLTRKTMRDLTSDKVSIYSSDNIPNVACLPLGTCLSVLRWWAPDSKKISIESKSNEC